MATAAPNATYPVITGTATTAPASCETSRKPFACNVIRVHGGLRTLSWGEGPLPRRPSAGQ